MQTNRWSLIEEVFQGALERPLAERKQYLADACGNDLELLSEIESLLESDHDAEHALRSLVAEDLTQLTRSSVSADLGSQVGPYLLCASWTAEGWVSSTLPSAQTITISK